MSITVLYFGPTADAVGVSEEKLGIANSVAELLARLAESHPKLAKHKLLIAVNEEYAESSTVLKDGDEVAVFTAVSGG